MPPRHHREGTQGWVFLFLFFSLTACGGLTQIDSVFSPCDVDLCAHHGTCTRAADVIFCECQRGWTGANCALDVDECAVRNGDCGDSTHFRCLNQEGAPPLCEAVNPCEIDHGGCGDPQWSLCQLDASGQVACIDVDECLDHHGGCDPLTRCLNQTQGPPRCGPCPEGYAGDGRSGCVPIDECETDNGGCDPLTSCVDDVGQEPVCGDCPSGYEGDGYRGCVDENECETNNGGCDVLTTCLNRVGAPRICGPCPEGYVGSGLTGCTDRNECLDNNGGCDPRTLCTNRIGSPPICGVCPAGFSGTGVSGCVDIDECTSNNGGCDPRVQCTNRIGASALCGSCPVGFSGDGYTECADIDECLANNGGCGDPNFVKCANRYGDLPICTDIDECLDNNGGCGNPAFVVCTNMFGTPPQCIDVNECEMNHGGCDPLVECINQWDAPATCGACPSGYEGEGNTGCTDLDECLDNNGGCDALTSCTNQIGALPICGPCPTGFSGNGESGCIDIDECLHQNGGCGDALYYTCTNQVGAPPACTDADECLIQNGGCDELTSCTNQIGAPPICGACPAGYTGDGESGCADIDECLTQNGGCGSPVFYRCINQQGDAPICQDTPTQVLILHDGWANARNTLHNALVDAGYHSVIGPAYYQYNGTNPSLTTDVVVIVLEGRIWGGTFLSGADTALVQHLNQGGWVIRSEWAAYDIADKWSNQTGFHTKMPVFSPAKGYHYGKTWTLASAIGALGNDVPNSFAVPADSGCSAVQAKSNAVVLATIANCGPGLSYIDVGIHGGRSFHINDDLGGEKQTTQAPELVQLYVNIVRASFP